MKSKKKALDLVLNKYLKAGRKTLIYIAVAAIFGALLMTVYHWMSVSYINTMVITLNYEGAKEGLNPDGSRFKISEIKSDEVLNAAIEKAEDDSLSVEKIKDRIFVDSKMPLSAIEKTSSSISQGSIYSYTPTEFDIYYSQKNKLKPNKSLDVLSALSEAYKEYFMAKYCEKNVILDFDSDADLSQYDYYEIQQVLEDKINSMINHLANHQSENSTFRSKKTGYTFKNLTNMLINLRDQDLAKLKAYIVQNQISRDTARFISKQDYLIDKDTQQYDTNMQASDITNSALSIYDPYITGVTFIPSIDQFDEYYMSRTKTGIDNLAMKSYNQGMTANKFKKEIDSRLYIVDKFTSASTADGSHESADTMIRDLCNHLEKISSVSLLTDDEYIAEKTKKYITVKLPERGLYIPIIQFVKYFILLLVVLFIALRAYQFSMEYLKKAKKATEEK
ncbi:MAG: hypothetical protein E7417_03745 [Ruminococcaceae bacterium]|nr:hypothetical protein [Oscillospiraceae bacterium]